MRVVLSGYYGFGNLGDEALLDVTVAQLRTRFPYVEIDVLSAQPHETVNRLQVEATSRWDARAVRASVRRADVLLSGGGGLLQNATSLRSLLYYVGIVHQAVHLKRRAMIFAQSIGPLDPLGRVVVREGCRGVARATVRDARSAKLLQSLLPAVAVEQTADPVFLYDAPDDEFDLEREGLGARSQPFAVLSIRRIAALNDAVALLARAADRLAAQGVAVAFLPLGGVPDAEAATSVIRKCTSAPMLLPEMSLPRAAAVLARAHVVIGMRLHALILAARYGVPFLAVPYDPKVTALCEDLAYPLPALWTAGEPIPSAAQVDALVDRLLEERASLQTHLLARLENVRMAAARNFDIAGELLRE
ncbi:MAG: polysaccharide pyruvyl transferase CsaB [Vulcanimicrobiaceae bacterium]